MNHRQGSTLLELLVTLAIMAIVASVVTLALRADAQTENDTGARVEIARRAARASRRPVTIELVVSGAPVLMTALPDGGVVGDSALRLDRLTGERSNAP